MDNLPQIEWVEWGCNGVHDVILDFRDPGSQRHFVCTVRTKQSEYKLWEHRPPDDERDTRYARPSDWRAPVSFREKLYIEQGIRSFPDQLSLEVYLVNLIMADVWELETVD